MILPRHHKFFDYWQPCPRPNDGIWCAGGTAFSSSQLLIPMADQSDSKILRPNTVHWEVCLGGDISGSISLRLYACDFSEAAVGTDATKFSTYTMLKEGTILVAGSGVQKYSQDLTEAELDALAAKNFSAGARISVQVRSTGPKPQMYSSMIATTYPRA